MPSIDAVEQYKRRIRNMADEPAITAARGMSLAEISPPSAELPDDLAALFQGMPEEAKTPLATDSPLSADEGLSPEQDLLSGLFDESQLDSADDMDFDPLAGLRGLEEEDSDLEDIPGGADSGDDSDFELDGGLEFSDSDLSGLDFQNYNDDLDVLPSEDSPQSPDPETSLDETLDDSLEEFPEDLEPGDLGSGEDLDLAGSLDNDDFFASLMEPEEDIPAAPEVRREKVGGRSPEELDDDFFSSPGERLYGRDEPEALDEVEDVEEAEDLEGDLGEDLGGADLGNDLPDLGFGLGEGEGDTEYVFDENSLESDFPELKGLDFSDNLENVDEDADDEFALGDFSAEFGLTSEDIGTGEEFLNPAQMVDGDIAAAQQDIALSDEDFGKLQKNLALLPLNLKIALEELLGEKDILPEDWNKLIRMLIQGASAKALAAEASRLLGKTIKVPAQYSKGSGDEVQQKLRSLGYNLRIITWPIVRNFLLASTALALLILAGNQWIRRPLMAHDLYTRGYEALVQGDSPQAEELFVRAYNHWPMRSWFFRYAQAYEDRRDYPAALNKFEQFLGIQRDERPDSATFGRVFYRRYDKEAILDYHRLLSLYAVDPQDPESQYRRANAVLQPILSRNLYDREALLARGDNEMRWARIRPERYEEALQQYSFYRERYGLDEPLLYRLLDYFRIQGNPRELSILSMNLQQWEELREARVDSLTAAASYFLDLDEERYRQETAPRGLVRESLGTAAPVGEVEEEERMDYMDEAVKLLDMAMAADITYPEIHLEFARYFRRRGNNRDEELALGSAEYYFRELPARDLWSREHIGSYVSTLNRIGEVFVRNTERNSAEIYFQEARQTFEEARSLDLLEPHQEFGRIYANLGNIFYFHTRDWTEALALYGQARDNGYYTPDLEYQQGVILYAQEDFPRALESFYRTEGLEGYRQHPIVLYAMGNALHRNGSYTAAQGYFTQLLTLYNEERRVIPELEFTDRPEHYVLMTNIMKAQNNMAVALFRGQAQSRVASPLFSQVAARITEADRIRDALSRDPETLERELESDVTSLNVRSILSEEREQNLLIFAELPLSLAESRL